MSENNGTANQQAVTTQVANQQDPMLEAAAILEAAGAEADAKMAAQEAEFRTQEGDLEASGEAETQEQPTTQVPEPESAQNEETKTQLWGRITSQDKEIRQLRAQVKGMTNMDQIKDMARKDPAKVMNDLGWNLDTVIDMLASNGVPASQGQASTQVKQPETNELAQMRQELAELKQSQVQAQQDHLARQEFSRMDSVLKANPDRWEVINAMRDQGSLNLVLETATELWKQTGQIPEYDFVMDSVEEHLAEQTRVQYQKLAAIKKFQAQQQQVAPAKQGIRPAQQKQAVINPNAPTASPHPLSDEERIRRAVELLESMPDDE